MYQKLMNQLIEHEGLELKPYRCPAGKLTLGVGRNIEDIGITRSEALYLLEGDIKRVRSELGAYYQWFYTLDPVRRDALTNMAFNLGISRFRKFRKMITAIELDDYATAADEMLDSKWAQQVGKRAKILAQMMRTGRYEQ